MKKQGLLRYIGLPIQYTGNVFLIVFFLLMTQSYNAQTNKAVIKGGEIGTKDNTTICLNGNSQPIDVYLEGAAGDLQQWIITDYDNNILGLPKAPPFSFEGAGPGICKIWSVSYKDIFNLEKGVNLSDLEGWYKLSNYIQITRNQPAGGTLSGGPFEFTVGDGEADNIYEGAITLEGNSGANSQWVVTDDQGNILGLPPSPYVVDFDGAGEGVCLVWHLSYDGEISGAEVGNNASDITGCYSLSNSIEVIRSYAVADGGTISGGPFTFCVGDGEADNISEGAITIEGSSGMNSQWVVTDDQGNILGLPPSPYVVNFDGAGPGECLVWYMRYNGEITGAEVGNNASDIEGDFDLSNSISVYRNQPAGGTLSGGPFEFTVGDGEADNIYEGAITLEGNSGANSQWVVTDDQGNILGLPPSPYVVDFDGAGEGVCLVWHLSYDGEISGAEVGNNASDITGCYSLSNSIEVIRSYSVANGGTISGGPFTFCVGDGEADNISEGAITIEGSSGMNSQWVVTDDQGNILGLPPSPYVVNFDGAGPGECLVWYMRYNGEITGAEVGNNASDIEGDFDLSNSISVYRNQPAGGTLSGGPFEFTVGDGEADNIYEGAITLEGNSGANSQWVVTDDQGNILGLPPSPYVVDFDGAGEGVCLVWHLSYDGEISGAEVGNNASDITGCYSLSNSIEVIRSYAVADGGTISGGPFTFCVGDGEADNISEGAITIEGSSGMNSQWVVTDDQGNILGLPPSPYVVNFDGAGSGECLVWYMRYNGEITGAEVGNNASDIEGDFDLSNSISVYRNQPAGGTLSGGPFEFTVGDGEADNIYEGAITLEGNSGANSQWVVTDDQGNILGLPPSPYVVDFDGAGEGVCLVWHLSYDGEISGAEVGNNASDITGCYSLSNSIKVIRKANDNGGDNGDVCDVNGGKLKPGGLYLFCEGDGINDYAEGISLEQNAGEYSQWVITDVEGNILGLPPSPDQVNFDVAGPGVCLIWHLSFNGEIYGANEGSNAFTDLKGCYDLSNPIPVFRFPSDSGLCDILIYSGKQLSDEDLSETNISMYPNPANHNVNIDLSNSLLEDVTVRIHSYSGSEVYRKSINLTSDKLMNVDVSELSQGLYLISITSNVDNSIKAVKKLLVE